MFLRYPLVTAPLWINQRLVPLAVSGVKNSALRGRFFLRVIPAKSCTQQFNFR
jgi:hypothetical protein